MTDTGALPGPFPEYIAAAPSKKGLGTGAKVLIAVAVGLGLTAGSVYGGYAYEHRTTVATQQRLAITQKHLVSTRKELSDTKSSLDSAQSEADSERTLAESCHSSTKALDDMLTKALSALESQTNGDYTSGMISLNDISDELTNSQADLTACLRDNPNA